MRIIYYKCNFAKNGKIRFDRGLNSGPSACKADVITTTPPNRCFIYDNLMLI
jgi:hypothetical protein